MANEQTPEQALAARSNHEVVNVFPERLIEQVLELIRQRDLRTSFHHMSPEQEASNRAFNTFGAGMAIRQYSPGVEPKRNDARDVLLFTVPQAATSARVWSTAGITDLKGAEVRNSQGYLPIPQSLRQERVARVEFYDARHTTIAISGAEAPPPPPQSDGFHYSPRS